MSTENQRDDNDVPHDNSVASEKLNEPSSSPTIESSEQPTNLVEPAANIEGAPLQALSRDQQISEAKDAAKKAVPGLIKKAGKALIFMTILGCVFMIFAVFMIVATFNKVISTGISAAGS